MSDGRPVPAGSADDAGSRWLRAGRSTDTPPLPMSDTHAASEPPTVLVVEDDRDLADTYTVWLESEYDVRTAYSGTMGLTWYDDEVDVVLLDRRMPELSGMAVLQKMERRDGDAQKAILTSAEPGGELADIPCDDYLTKPVTKSGLRDAVRELQMRSRLDDDLQRHFALTSKIAVLEHSDAEGVEAALDDLRREADRTRARVEDRISDLDGFEPAFETID
jgi:DNA-binding response OmpR family regulator